MTGSERGRERARELQGRRAGFVSRVVAAAIDIGIVFAAYELALVAYGLVRSLLTEKSFELPTPPAWFSGTMLALLIIAALAIAWSGSGRTLGSSAIGLRVVTDRGEPLTFGRAVGRAAVLVVLPFVSMGWIIVSKKNAGLHDLAAHTTVIYDWHPRHEPFHAVPAAAPVARPAVPDPVESRPI
jgi:uncharacterized RDD family membrane protein YckC